MTLKEIFLLFNLANINPSKIIDKILNLDNNKDFNIKIFFELFQLTEKEKFKINEILKNKILEKELSNIKKEGIKIIDIFDKEYPKLLKEITCPPLLLYARGDLNILNEFLFGIVGSRIPTIYGISMAEEFSYKLSSLGIVIVSGLARGIDTIAHKSAIKGGKTVAVLGSGLLNIYPKENKKLTEEIINKGVILSEFPLEFPPLKENFPRRNRIISGLSKGVLVVEASLKSGALITARYALEQNREVFALPGKADSPLSKGTHLLIKEGAKLVDSVEDILEEFNINFKNLNFSFNLTEQEKAVFDIINKDGVYLEELILKSNIESSTLNKIILDLQFKGLIREIRPSYYIKCYE